MATKHDDPGRETKNKTTGDQIESMANSTMIELDDLRKEFGDLVAVDGVNFEVKQGEFFSLLGPSGCGKTTTLRMISGFEHPTEGEVLLKGETATELPPDERDTNLVFQHLSLFPHMTVGENIGYGLKKKGIDADERERRVNEYLELVDLGGFQGRNPTELSGGQQQRVALARALVNEPSVLLLDEPLASLDRKLRQQMQIELRNIHEKVQGSFFYVTHDQGVAMTLSDRLAIMRDGHIEQVGPPEEVYREPATEFVADFIGDTNLFDGTARMENGMTTVEVGGEDGFSFDVSSSVTDGDVTVAIRPEELYTTGDGETHIDGTVIERYFKGDQTNYVVEPDIGGLPELEVIESGRRAQYKEGDDISLMFNEDSVVLFD